MTARPNAWLLRHAKNVHSLSGEDGILAEVIKLLPGRTGWCVEFGAWDGVHLSNTAHLIESADYSGILIEGDRGRFEDLRRRCADRPRLHPICAFVGFEQSDGLDTILRATPIPRDFDLLSIDIDGNDYHVWEAVTEHTPRCVVIEYNPTVPTGVHFVQVRDHRVMQGASIDALVDLGKRKGYELVCVTSHNGIFVRRDDFPAFEIADNSVHALRVDQTYVTHIFCGYDGTVFLRGCGKLPWHNVAYQEALMQPLPRFLRSWTESYGPVRSKLFGAYKRARHFIGSRF